MHHALAIRNGPTDGRGFEGNPDIYGIGIRLGYYTQALSIWAANFFVPHEARYLHSLNVLFIIAMLLAMSYLCATPTESYGVEIFLLHQIAYTIASVGVTPSYRPKWSWTFRHRLARDVVFVALDTFSVWFWYIGLSKGNLKPTPGPDGTLVWWMNQGNLYGKSSILPLHRPFLFCLGELFYFGLSCTIYSGRYSKNCFLTVPP